MTTNYFLPERKTYEAQALSDPWKVRLFIYNRDLVENIIIQEKCRIWLEEHVGKMFKDWACPARRLPVDENDHERWTMYLFAREEDAMLFRLIWG